MVSQSITSDILKNVARFITLDENEQQQFISILKVRSLKKKEFLIRPGEVNPYDYYVNKGCVRCYYLDDYGFEKIIYFGVEDYWIGDLFSFVTQKSTRLYIDALEETQLLYYSSHDVNKLYQRVPKFEHFFRINFQRAAIALETRLIQFLSVRAEDRYQQFLDSYPGLEGRIPQKHIAAYLGITPVFLSQIRRKFAKGKNH
jgi:CRP-like cAMP-binding protein